MYVAKRWCGQIKRCHPPPSPSPASMADACFIEAGETRNVNEDRFVLFVCSATSFSRYR